MQGYIPLFILIAVSIIIWVYFIIYFRTRNKNILVFFKQLSEKYGFLLDESNRVGSIIYPLLKGVYKNRQIGIGCYFNKEGGKKQVSTYIRVECSNPKNIAFNIIQKLKNSARAGGNIVNMMDSEFDEKFIVSSSTPDYILPIFSFNIKYSLIQVSNLGFKGDLKIEGNLLDYTEPELMLSENSKTRIELIMHILCDLADEIGKIS